MTVNQYVYFDADPDLQLMQIKKMKPNMDGAALAEVGSLWVLSA